VNLNSAYNARVDVVFCGVVDRVTADIDAGRMLVDADVVNSHCRGECKVLKIDRAPVVGHGEVGNDVLCETISGSYTREKLAHHRLLGDRAL
jgi:hypothetical protein